LTVIVPTFNRCDWLPRAVESVLAQTYPDFRLIISDNASTDETSEVAASFHDPRISYVRRDRHRGLNEHYNLCIDEVSTKYFLIVPDDDALLPEAIEALLPVLEDNPRLGIAHGRVRIVYGDAVVSPSHDMTGLERDTAECGATFIRRAMRSSHRVHATTVLYRTQAVKPVPLDQRDYPATEFGVWLRLALDWDIAFVAKTIAVYRLHADTYTSQNARVTGGGYVQAPETIENVYDVKLRFLAENGHRLADVRGLQRDARRALTSQLVNYAGHMTLPERSLRTTLGVLGECARRDPRVSIAPGAWRLVAGSILGRRLTERVKRRLRAPSEQWEAVGR
jgi:glycosyltransferase involved in cell wall biosynthesis